MIKAEEKTFEREYESEEMMKEYESEDMFKEYDRKYNNEDYENEEFKKKIQINKLLKNTTLEEKTNINNKKIVIGKNKEKYRKELKNISFIEETTFLFETKKDYSNLKIKEFYSCFSESKENIQRKIRIHKYLPHDNNYENVGLKKADQIYYKGVAILKQNPLYIKKSKKEQDEEKIKYFKRYFKRLTSLTIKELKKWNDKEKVTY